MKKMNLILAAGLLLISTAALAQPGPHGGMMPPPPGMMDGGGPGACEDPCPRDKDRKMLEAVRITRMTEALELTDKQIAEFFPKLKEMEANMREAGRQQQKYLGQLDSMLISGAKDQELKAKMTQIENAEAERWQRMKSFKMKLDGILTIKQKAKMLVFNQKFDEEIRDMVRDIRQKKMRRYGQ
jgi:Spy/CpxP family protein refolding chaperone